jgi:hypothetical protein
LHGGRVVDPQQLRGAGGGLDNELPRQLRVEAVRRAGIGDRLDRQGQVGGRAAHDRGGRVEILVAYLDHMPERRQCPTHLLGSLAGDAEHPSAYLHAHVRHHPQHFGPGKRLLQPLQRHRREDRGDPLRGTQIGRDGVERRRLDRDDDEIRPLGDLAIGGDLAAELVGQRLRAPGAAVGEQHSLELPAPAAGHGGGHASGADESDDHRPQTSRRWTARTG